jgi:hypothetical protein
MIIRLPSGPSLASLEDRLRLASTGIHGTGVLIPGVSATNIFFATEDPTIDRMKSLSESVDFLAPDTYDFWRNPPSFYDAFRRLRVVARRGRHSPKALSELLTTLCGRTPEIIWPLLADARDRH